jgi:hypothetical protein
MSALSLRFFYDDSSMASPTLESCMVNNIRPLKSAAARKRLSARSAVVRGEERERENEEDDVEGKREMPSGESERYFRRTLDSFILFFQR